MSSWTKEELEKMVNDVVSELNLSDTALEKHRQLKTSPAELVRLVIDEKDMDIIALRNGIKLTRSERFYSIIKDEQRIQDEKEFKEDLVNNIEHHLAAFYSASEDHRDALNCDMTLSTINKHIKKMADHAAILTELRAQIAEIEGGKS